MADAIYSQLGIDPSIAPQPSPALLTYLRGLGLDMGMVQEQKQRRLATVAANKIRQDAQIAEANTKANENKVADSSARGVTNSGENDKGLAEVANQTLKAYNESSLGAAADTADAEREASMATAGITRSATEYLLQMSEQQQREAAQQAAQMEMERARMTAEQQQFDSYLALLREQGSAGTLPYQNPYELASQQIGRETYASLGSAPPETNFTMPPSLAAPARPTLSTSPKSRYVKAV
jgi:uncharacterized membrane protein YccC